MKLSVADLFKTYKKGPLLGKPRLIRFAEKYKTGDDFELENGDKIKLHFIPETYKLLIEASKYPTKYQKELQKAQFAAIKGKQYYKITDFKKTIEFEGKPDIPPAGIQYEQNTINRLNIILKNIMLKHAYKDGVPIVCKGKIVGKAVGARKVEGTPKADLALVDAKGNEVVWISYKKGRSVKDFQQWGGITSDVMQSFPQVQDFIARVRRRFPQGLRSGDNAGMHIKGPNAYKIKMKAVYGDDYAPNAAYSRNNVNFVVQGRLDIKESGKGYTLTSSDAHCYVNGERFRASEDPVFFVNYRTDRDQYGIPKARMVINPYGGTTIKEWLD